MGKLVLTAVGTGVGAFFGGQTGAFIGGAIGGLAGDLLFPPDPIERVGPRIGDLTSSGSEFGSFINIPYGAPRLGGQLIWFDAREVRTTTTQGGKGGGGPEVETTTFSAIASMAISFCEGPIEDILQIYLNGQLMFDKLSADFEQVPGFTFRFYAGNEEQLPDPTLEAVVGVGRTPAYRGQCYIVITDLNLSPFGNSLPKLFEAVVAKTATNASSETTLTRISAGGINSQMVAADFERGYLYAYTSGPNKIIRIRISDLTEDRFSEDIVSGKGLHGILPTGELVTGNNSAGGVSQIEIRDPLSFQILHTRAGVFGFGSGFSGRVAAIEAVGGTGLVQFLLFTSFDQGGVGILRFGFRSMQDGKSLDFLFSESFGTNDNYGAVAGFRGQGEGKGYAIFSPQLPTTGDLFIQEYQISADADVVLGVTVGVFSTQLCSISPSDVDPTKTQFTAIRGLAFDQLDGGLIFFVSFGSVGGSDFRAVKVSSQGVIVWITTVDYIPPLPSENNTRLQNGNYGVTGVMSASNGRYALDTITGEIIEVGGLGGVSTVAGQIYDSRRATVYTGGGSEFRAVRFFRATSPGEDLADVVSNLSERAGLDPAEYDVSELVATVRAFTITRQAQARTSLEALQGAFFFDSVESDLKIRHKMRGSASVATIPEDHLQEVEEGKLVEETRVQEVDLPRRLTINYVDVDKQQQPGAISASRITLPNRASVQTESELTVEVPVGLTATEAKQIAERRLYLAYVTRQSFKLAIPWRYLALDPADVLTVQFSDFTQLLRARESTIAGQGFAIELQASSEDTPAYTSTALGDAGDGAPVQAFPYQGPSKLFVLDIPLLQDVDDVSPGASRRYYSGSIFEDGVNWPGAIIYLSPNGNVGEAVDAVDVPAIWGSAVEALPAPSSPYRSDLVNTVKVAIGAGIDDLQSATLDALLADPTLNNALLGQELIRFTDVVDNGDGSVTLTPTIRGLRGTDALVDTHVTGEVFLLLSRQVVHGSLTPLSQLNASLFYRAVTRGTIPGETPAEIISVEGRDLFPYAPVLAERLDDSPSAGDITLSWVRRDRLSGGSVTSPPLSEASESYEVDVLDGPGGNVLRTLTSSTNSVEYDSADVTTDFGGLPATLYVRIYQISATIGRGFSIEYALEAT